MLMAMCLAFKLTYAKLFSIKSLGYILGGAGFDIWTIKLAAHFCSCIFIWKKNENVLLLHVTDTI